MSADVLPPLTANIAQACFKCFKDEAPDVPLKKCTCQKKDWTTHKAICKALSSIEKNHLDLFEAPPEPPSPHPNFEIDTQAVNELADEHTRNEIQLCEIALKRPLDVMERNLIAFEPRCMVCARTDRILRSFASKNNLPATASLALTPCPHCKTSFTCSPAHYALISKTHLLPPSPSPSPESPSHCQTNQQIRADLTFAHLTRGFLSESSSSGSFQWAPERTKARWTSLKNTGWMEEYSDEFTDNLGLDPATMSADPFIRASSEGLSMPMTVLWALECLNDGVGLGWTEKETLTVHILGAHQKELLGSQIFEEILHRLPLVKTLNLVLIGPQIVQVMPLNECGKWIDMDTCGDCLQDRRKRRHIHYAETYHSFAKQPGFTKPDLAVAFDSGSSQEETNSWKETIKFLIDNKIPSVFTAYNRDEAEEEAKMLTDAGATLVSGLGPSKNPWGSLLNIPEPSKVTGFYSVNGWLAGGFR